MRLRVNECTMRLWDEWTMRLKMSECTMRFMKWVDDGFNEMYGRCVLWNKWTMRLKVNECVMRFMRWMDDAFKSEWMYDAFMKWMDDAFKSEWMCDAFMCVCFFFVFFEFVWLLCLCRHETSRSDETDFRRTMKWSVHLVSWYPIRLVHLRFHRLVVGESPPWLLSADWTLVTNDVFAHWELVFPSSDCASSLSMCVCMCVSSLFFFR